MTKNAAHAFAQVGQSIWYDNIRRSSLENGEFAQLLRDGVRGCTSNPSIFDKAIGDSSDYDDALRRLVSEGRVTKEIYYELVIDDIRAAADQMFELYESSNFVDGYVSVEVLPHSAHSTELTVNEAKQLYSRIGRSNVMIKVPATQAGLPAITTLIGQGIPVNVTLIFSQSRYLEVAEAFIAGLEQARKNGHDLKRIASVASFFVSRIDSKIDAWLKAEIKTSSNKSTLKALLGKGAIANAKLAYQKYEQLFSSERFKPLAAKGAQTQRVLWASTGTKDPSYPDTLYVDSLICRDTVNTVPPATLEAFQDHGTVKNALSGGYETAQADLTALAEAGHDLADTCATLEAEGVAAFISSMDNLLGVIECRRQALLEQSRERQSFALGNSSQAVTSALDRSRGLAARIWAKDPSAFTQDETHSASIKNRLGWLTSPLAMQSQVDDLLAFTKEVYQAGFKKVLLLGMGGSSLCPEVLAATFGKTQGHLELRVLDSTDPSAVKSAEAWADLNETLFIVASKSGGTIEVISFLAHFWELAKAKFASKAGERFVAITDPTPPGQTPSPLHQLATRSKFRRVFLNPADIGGRFSAVSLFGLVPAALLGIDVTRLLDDAQRMAQSCGAKVPAHENPGVRLGAFIAGLALAGRDKLTLITSPEVASIGSWIEQLIAESTGKACLIDGKPVRRGIVPVDGEPVSEPTSYAEDRAFVYIRYGGKTKTPLDAQVSQLIATGAPVATLGLFDLCDVGGEFVRWEMATAVAGALLGVNPFDEPNVSEAKEATKQLLGSFESEGRLGSPTRGSLRTLSDVISKARPGCYVAISAFFENTPSRAALLQKMRQSIRTKTNVACTIGFGPRFLHSTGQLHKGGPEHGIFIVLTRSEEELPIPGQEYSFGTLLNAQAFGDLRVLADHGLPVLHVDLGDDVESGLQKLDRELS